MTAVFNASDFSQAALTVEALRARGEPKTLERDSDVWKAKLISWFEAETGRTLYPDQTEMFLIEMCAYALSMIGEDGHASIMQNLAVFAQGDWLDLLASNASLTRLPAAYATVAMRATIPAATNADVVMPAGLIVGTGNTAFALDAELRISAGETQASGSAKALQPGPAANGLQPGQLALSLGSIATGLAIENTDVSAGGALAETDDHLRLVTVDAPHQFDRRGGWAGYGLAVRRVNPDIVDVAIDRPQPGHIHLVIKMVDGSAPGQALLDKVAAAFDPDVVAPMGDYLTDVRGGTPFEVDGTLTLRIAPGSDVVAITQAARTRVADAVNAKRRPALAGSARTRFSPEDGALGAQIAPSAITAAVMGIAGVVDATLDGVVYRDLSFDQFPVLGNFMINTVSGADV